MTLLTNYVSVFASSALLFRPPFLPPSFFPLHLFPHRTLHPLHPLLNPPLYLPHPCLRLLRQRLLPSTPVPVPQVSVPLHELAAEVDGVAPEEQVVCGRDGEGVAHEGGGVEG